MSEHARRLVKCCWRLSCANMIPIANWICGRVAQGEFVECLIRSVPMIARVLGIAFMSSVYNTSLSVPSCTILDVTCKATCRCHVGYSTQKLFMTTLETRHSLVQAIRSLSLLQRPTPDALVSRITALSSIAGDSEGINNESKRLIANMTVEITDAAYVARLSVEDLRGSSTII
jgi:hypothetical protein